MDKTKININNFNQQLIIAGMTNLVDDEGYTPREVFQLLDDIQNNMWHALQEIYMENTKKVGE